MKSVVRSVAESFASLMNYRGDDYVMGHLGIRRSHDNSGLVESPFTCTVRIIDDKGRECSHKVDGWWKPEKTVLAKPWYRFW